MDFNFTVHHVATDKNWADAMSRLPVVKGPDGELEYRKDEVIYEDTNPPPLSADEVQLDPLWVSATTRADTAADAGYPGLKKAQQDDPEAKELIHLIKEKGKPLKRRQQTFKMVDDCLVAVNKKRQQRYYIPECLVRLLLKEEHSSPASGHLGKEKMLANMQKKYYWPRMAADISEWTKTCHTCQVVKSGFSHLRPELGSLPRPQRGQQVIALDIKGPFSVSRDKKRFVIVGVDLFTKYAYTRAVPNVEGKTVGNFLMDEVFRFGVPETVLTDNAPNLKQSIPGVLYRRMGIKSLNSTPYHPSSNGAVERLIQTLGTMIKCASQDDPNGWSEWIPRLTTKYNHTVHKSTGFSPFVLHFAYEPRDATILDLPTSDQENVGEQARWLKKLQETRERVEEAARKAMNKYYAKMASDFNADPSRKVGPTRFHVGQWVLVRLLQADPGVSKGLKPAYFGPAEIMSLTEHYARVMFMSNGAERVRNVAHLKPYFLREDDEEVYARFTAPKRGKKRATSEESDDDAEEIDERNDVDTGIVPGSPLAADKGNGEDGQQQED